MLPSGAVARTADKAGPYLKRASAPGYAIAVAGVGWGANARVTFSLTQGTNVVGLELQTTGAGRLLVGINNIYLCNGETFRARDFNGHHATLDGPALGCKAIKNPPIPQLTVLKGKLLQIKVTYLRDTGSITPVVIRLADAVFLAEPGTIRPSWSPQAPNKYFELIRQGQTCALGQNSRPCPMTRTMATACVKIACGPTFYWEWVGMKVGDTGIVLNPACYPKCMWPAGLSLFE
jgi:hypothetical protein